MHLKIPSCSIPINTVAEEILEEDSAEEYLSIISSDDEPEGSWIPYLEKEKYRALSKITAHFAALILMMKM